MNDPSTTLEPLADHLQPQFGNVYDYNFKVEGQFDVQEWTDELKQAVKDYLMHKAPEDLRDQVVTQLTSLTHGIESREKQIDSIIAAYEPWEIALAFHEAAVIAAPTLHVLIGHLDHWRYEDDRIDATRWLDEHATGEQLRQAATESGDIQLLTQKHLYNDLVEALVQVLEPPALLAAWSDAVGPALSDLTDAEWTLLIPLLPKNPKFSSYPASWLPVTRKALDGLFYWLTNRVRWSHIPNRYGGWQVLYSRWVRYKNNGVFRRMYLELRDKPEAKRIVEWLPALDPSVKL